MKQLGSLILPASATILVPFILRLIFPSSDMTILRVLLAVPFTGGGLALLISTIMLFERIGKGTLAPWHPTRKLVVTGPYRFCRNPMITGVLLVLLAQAILGSMAVLAWAVFFFGANHIYFIYIEEPGLVQRFGVEYISYKAAVPRWLPIMRRWGT